MVERPISDRLAARLEQSKELSYRLGSQVSATHFRATTRNRLAGGCFDLSLEHHNAVIALVEARLAACAFALLRVMYESHVRGVWLRYIATEEDIQSYQNCRQKPLDRMVREISAHPDWKDVGYSRFQAYAKNILDDYVHAGFRAVSRRISADAIEEVHEEGQEIESLLFADLWAVNTTEEVMLMSENSACAMEYKAEALALIEELLATKTYRSSIAGF